MQGNVKIQILDREKNPIPNATVVVSSMTTDSIQIEGANMGIIYLETDDEGAIEVRFSGTLRGKLFISSQGKTKLVEVFDGANILMDTHVLFQS
jgi:hypothetical protein